MSLEFPETNEESFDPAEFDGDLSNLYNYYSEAKYYHLRIGEFCRSDKNEVEMNRLYNEMIDLAISAYLQTRGAVEELPEIIEQALKSHKYFLMSPAEHSKFLEDVVRGISARGKRLNVVGADESVDLDGFENDYSVKVLGREFTGVFHDGVGGKNKRQELLDKLLKDASDALLKTKGSPEVLVLIEKLFADSIYFRKIPGGYCSFLGKLAMRVSANCSTEEK